MRRFICIVLIVAVLTCTLGSTYAAVPEQDILPMYTHIKNIKLDFTIEGENGEAYGSVQPINMSHKTVLILRIQKREDGVWRAAATWTENCTSGISEVGGSKDLESGYQYRAYLTCRVYDSSGTLLETAYKASPIQTY